MKMLTQQVCVRSLVEKVNCLDGKVWGCEPIKLDEIREAVSAVTDCVPPYNTVKDSAEPEGG